MLPTLYSIAPAAPEALCSAVRTSRGLGSGAGVARLLSPGAAGGGIWTREHLKRGAG